MNYQRIYDEFIRDRQSKPIPEVCETHHIFPRCLGGTNKRANLIKLSLIDHLFAHLLLAKIHGGLLSIAFSLMLDNTKYSGHRSKLDYNYRRLEARHHISASMLGNQFPKGAVRSAKTKALLSKAQEGNRKRAGKPQSEAERLKRSNTMKAKWASREGSDLMMAGISRHYGGTFS